MENSDAERIPTGMRLTKSAIDKMDAASERLGRSRASVVEILVYLYADSLTKETMIPAGAIPPESRAKKKSKKGK